MAANSNIEWTTHTFNPWRGCAKVSAGCANCYAEALSERNPKTLGVWGASGTRVVAAEAAWREPLKWNREAAWCGNPACKAEAVGRTGGRCACGLAVERPRVFCASLADVFEDWSGHMVDAQGDVLWHKNGRVVGAGQTTPGNVFGERPATMADVRQQLFDLIDATPNLDWLLVTKRPERIARMMPPVRCTRCFGGPCDPNCPERDRARPNLWLLTSVENQDAADRRIPELLKVPAVVHGLSMEPLLGPVRFEVSSGVCHCGIGVEDHGISDGHSPVDRPYSLLDGIDWVIVGGESGHQARPMHPNWARGVRDQCQAAGVPFFFKQWGEWGPAPAEGKRPLDSYWFLDGTTVSRFGKKAAGRLLDGQEWSEYPAAGVAS